MGTTATAILKLKVEGGSAVTSEVRAATADLVRAQKDIEKASVEAAKRIEAAQKAAADRTRARRKKDGAEVVQETRAVVAQQGAAYRQGAVVIERTEQLVTRAKLRELALQGDAQKRFVALYTEAEKRATAALEAEVGKRTTLSERERRQIETVALAMVSEHEQAERRRTAASARESQRRLAQERTNARAAAATWRDAGAVAGAVAHGAQEYAGQAHAVIQDAVGRRNAIQSTVAESLLQVGVTDAPSIDRYTDMVIAAGGPASQGGHNMRPEVIAEAIRNAQEKTNLIGRMGGASGGARDAIFSDAIQTAVRGRNLGLDPAEFTELHGMLGGRGMMDTDRSQLEAWAVGAQDRGAVNISRLLQQSKSAIVQRMANASNALPATATREQRSSAEAGAFRQAVAEIEVLRDAGNNPGIAANAMATYERVLSNSGTQAKLRENASHIRDRTVRGRVQGFFGRDGALREDLHNPMMFNAALLAAGMTDPTETANIFAGTGAGNPQALTANVRRMQAALLARDANNQTGVDRVNAYLGIGADSIGISPDEERRRAAARTNLGTNVAEGQSVAGMRNTLAHGDQVRVSQAAMNAARTNPLGMAALGTTVTGFGALAMKSPAGAAALGMLAGGFATVKSVLSGQTVDGRQLSAPDRVNRGARYVMAGALAPFLGPAAVALGMGSGALDVARVGGNQFTGTGMREAITHAFLDALPERIAQALRDNPPIIAGTPTADVHTQTTGAGNGGR